MNIEQIKWYKKCHRVGYDKEGVIKLGNSMSVTILIKNFIEKETEKIKNYYELKKIHNGYEIKVITAYGKEELKKLLKNF